MRVKQTILHIGLEKTGTTSIQHLLWENREALRAQGIFIPSTVNAGNNFHLAIASYSEFRADGLTKQLGIFNQNDLENFRSKKLDDLSAEFINSECDRAIISSEHFQSRLTKKADLVLLRRILQEAGFENFKVLLYLRDPLKITMSHHGMAIKKGIAVEPDFYRPDHPRISQILSFKNTIATWREVFDEISVKLYPEGKGPQALLEDFVSETQIHPDTMDWSKREPRNVNLSQTALQILNQLNHESDIIRMLSQDRWLFNKFEMKFPGKGITPDAKLIQSFDQHFEREFKDIQSQFFPERSRLFESEWATTPQSDLFESKKMSRQIRALILRARLRQYLRKAIKAIR